MVLMEYGSSSRTDYKRSFKSWLFTFDELPLHTLIQVPPEDLAAHAAWVKGQKEVAVLKLVNSWDLNFICTSMGNAVNETNMPMLEAAEESLPKKDANPALHAIRATEGFRKTKRINRTKLVEWVKHCVRTRQYLSMGDFGTDNQEKDEKQSQNDKTGLGMEKTVKDKAKSKPESQSSQKVNRKVNWSKSKSTQVNPGVKVKEI
ncbi:hypothetical protein Tco_1093853 [Tanacetum coccineum]|uniref:Uncharacterized protein n=1 Tax=Tanacetum coccineum TaxID=301880 RepID=A0ABQ5IEE3_9ASTR